MRTVEELIAAIRQEAARADFPIDEAPYAKAKKDPLTPVLFAGSLDATLCSFGRDLGWNEVVEGQPQIGAAGRLVREGVFRTFVGGEPPKTDLYLPQALDHVLLTNTVPYKPPGNKAYTETVKRRFRPFLAELLAVHWKGDRVLCLGTEAFKWFTPYTEAGAVDAFWKREDRYEAELAAVIVAETDAGEVRRPVVLCPLPHPSPLNQKWYPLFPGLLAKRLAAAQAG